jgi:hypothetical protein
MKHAVKDADNPFFRSKYADLQSVVEATRPSLAENGLSVVQITEGNVLWTMLLHTSGEWIKGSIELKPMRQVKDTGWVESNDPQSYGSCITYARRYAMAAITGCATEDDDGNAASGNKVPPKPGVVTAVSTKSGINETTTSADVPTTLTNLTKDGKKSIQDLRKDFGELCAISVEAGMFPNDGDATQWSLSSEKFQSKCKDIGGINKDWQVENAIKKLTARLNSKQAMDDDIPY